MREAGTANNIMTSLVRASRANFDEPGSKMGPNHEGLTKEEVYSNFFELNFAEHDALANSLAMGICLMATRPEVQDWIAEEIQFVLGGIDPRASTHEAAVSRLPRCLAIAVSASLIIY